MCHVVFQNVINEGDHVIAHVCPSCAEMFNLATSDTCCNGNVCLVDGCQNETSLVHYLWDSRPEVDQKRQTAEKIADRLLALNGNGDHKTATMLTPSIGWPQDDKSIVGGYYCRSEIIEAIRPLL